MNSWFLIDHGPLDGSLNMACDEFLLQEGYDRPVLRFYQWATPTLSLGISQKVDRHVDEKACIANGVDIVRRITGGKAVLHDRELTYSITGSMEQPPFDVDLISSYGKIAEAFCRAFQKLNIPAEMAPATTRAAPGGVTSCFANPSACEIVVQGKKLLGSAQKRTRSRVLQHGSLLIEYSGELWDSVMKRKLPVGHHRIACLKDILDGSVHLPELKDSLVVAFEEQFGVVLEKLEISGSDWEEIEKLARDKYSEPVPGA